MARNIYITAMGPYSGKSVVALGFTEMLSARLQRVGFFRPIIRSATEPDPQIELMRHRYQLQSSYAEMHGPTADAVTALIANGAHEEIEKQVLTAYRELERRCDFVVCEGTDFVGSTPALDFDLNANLANQLGCPVLVVINGAASTDIVEEVQLAREELQRKDCELFGVIVNRVAPAAVDEVETRLAPNTGQEWVYVMPEHAELGYPSVGEIQATLGARPVLAVDGMLDRDVREVRVAAMSAEHFIEDLEDGTLVVVPADRSDIVVACLASTLSPSFPAVSGLLLTGGYQLSPTVRGLLETSPFPVFEIDARTHVAAAAISGVRPVLRAENERKIAAALGLFERSVDKVELQMRFMVERPARMTPTMFEYELIEQAKSARRHIVLPEGEDDRVLRAADILLRRGVVAADGAGRPRRGARACRRAGPEPGRRGDPGSPELAAARALRLGLPRAAQAQGDNRGDRPRRARRPHLLRHDDGPPGRGRRHGLRGGSHNRRHDPPGVRVHQVPSRRLGRFERLLHVPRRPRAGLRRLCRQPQA